MASGWSGRRQAVVEAEIEASIYATTVSVHRNVTDHVLSAIALRYVYEMLSGGATGAKSAISDNCILFVPVQFGCHTRGVHVQLKLKLNLCDRGCKTDGGLWSTYSARLTRRTGRNATGMWHVYIY